MKHEEIIKKIDFADECNKDVAGNFGRTMTITMEEAFLFKQLLEKQVNGDETSQEKALHKHIVNCFKTDGEQLIKTLGFELDHSYDHDQFHTNRYRKGLLMVEFIYEGFTLKTIDLTMDEVFCKPITYAELKAITPILGDIPT